MSQRCMYINIILCYKTNIYSGETETVWGVVFWAGGDVAQPGLSYFSLLSAGIIGLCCVPSLVPGGVRLFYSLKKLLSAESLLELFLSFVFT